MVKPMYSTRTTIVPAAASSLLPLRKLGPVLCLALALSACTPPEETSLANEQPDMTEPYRVSGAIAYRERIALQPESVISVRLEGVSVADRAADLLAEDISRADGRQVPIRFTLRVSPEKILPGRHYALRAAIRSPEGRLAWTTDTVHAIDPALRDQDLGTLTLVRVGAATETSIQDGQPRIDLQDREWVVARLNGTDPLADSRMTLNFDSEGRLWGQAGCNNYTTTYDLTGGALSIGPTAVTNRACEPEIMNQESSFLRLLDGSGKLSIADDGALRVETADGRTMLAYAD